MPSFRVEGLKCAHCAQAVQKAGAAVAPDADIRVDLASGVVEIDAAAAQVPAILQAIRAEGYEGITPLSG